MMAKALGFNRTTIYNWRAAFRERGGDALKANPVPGRPRKLQARHSEHGYRMFAGKGPRQLRFPFGLWIEATVRELIRRGGEAALSEVSVGRLLRTMCLSPERPTDRAHPQDPGVIRQSPEAEHPSIRVQAHTVDAQICFADDATVRFDRRADTSSAPVGETPAVTSTGARFSFNWISAVSPKGLVQYRVLSARLAAPVFIAFRRRLLHDVRRPLSLIVDGQTFHRFRAARTTSGAPAAACVSCPAPRSSQLHPGELVCCNVMGHSPGPSQLAEPYDLPTVTHRTVARLPRRSRPASHP